MVYACMWEMEKNKGQTTSMDWHPLHLHFSSVPRDPPQTFILSLGCDSRQYEQIAMIASCRASCEPDG